MVLLNLEFPILVRNNRDVIQVVGRLRFPPLSTTEVTHRQFISNKKFIEQALEVGIIELIQPEEAAVEETEEMLEEEAVAKEATEEVKTEDKAVQEKSVVARFHAGEVSWQHAVKEIGTITDKNVLADLYEEALMLGVKEDGIVVKSLRSALEDL